MRSSTPLRRFAFPERGSRIFDFAVMGVPPQRASLVHFSMLGWRTLGSDSSHPTLTDLCALGHSVHVYPDHSIGRPEGRAMEPDVLNRLRRVAGRQTLTLTHYGRKSGKPYEVTIWFVLG